MHESVFFGELPDLVEIVLPRENEGLRLGVILWFFARLVSCAFLGVLVVLRLPAMRAARRRRSDQGCQA